MGDLERVGSAKSEEGSAAIVFILILAVILFITSQQSHTGAYGLGSRHYQSDRSLGRYRYTNDYDQQANLRYNEDRDSYSYNRYSVDDLYYRDKFEQDSFGDYDDDYFYNPQEN